MSISVGDPPLVSPPPAVPLAAPDPSPPLLSCEEVLKYIHHLDTSLLAVHPCDTPSSSDRQTNWKSEQLNQITGCCQFKNYKNLLALTRDGNFVSTGEFPTALGSYAMVPKAARASQSTAQTTVILIKSTWILSSVTFMWLAMHITSSSLLTARLSSIGFFHLKHCPHLTFFMLLISSTPKRAGAINAFAETVTKNSSAKPSKLTSLTRPAIPKSSLRLPVVNLPMVSL